MATQPLLTNLGARTQRSGYQNGSQRPRTQARSLPINRWAVEQIHHGAIGTISKVEVPNFLSPRDYKTPETLKPCPAGLDWDRWTDQAPLYPCDPDLLGSTEAWGLYREFDGGGSTWGMTGFGTHAFDQIQWALGKDKELPVEICTAETNNPRNRSPFYMKYADGVTIVMRAEGVGGPRFWRYLLRQRGQGGNQSKPVPHEPGGDCRGDAEGSESFRVRTRQELARLYAEPERPDCDS
jgi:hypothetical protein